MSTRILYLVRTTLGLSGQLESRDRVAEAAVFSDGPAVLHWLTDPASTEVYPSEAAMRQMREASGRSRFEDQVPDQRASGTDIPEVEPYPGMRGYTERVAREAAERATWSPS